MCSLQGPEILCHAFGSAAVFGEKLVPRLFPGVPCGIVGSQGATRLNALKLLSAKTASNAAYKCNVLRVAGGRGGSKFCLVRTVIGPVLPLAEVTSEAEGLMSAVNAVPVLGVAVIRFFPPPTQRPA